MINEKTNVKKNTFNWRLFFVLVICGFVASIAMMPYLLEFVGDLLEDQSIPFSLTAIKVLGVFQTFVTIIVSIFIGMILSKKVNLGAPVLEAKVNGEDVDVNWRSFIFKAVGCGFLVSILVLIGDYIFTLLDSPISLFESDLPVWWKGLLGAFYGGIGEELLLRFFVMTLFVWILKKVSRIKGDEIPKGIIWTSIILAAVLFGVMHLPMTAALAPLSFLLVIRAILINGIGGVVLGYLYWKEGLLSAMIAHFTVDIVMHALLQLLV